MNAVDIAILIVVLIPSLIGLKKGFLKSVFSLISILVGLYLATKFYTSVASYVSVVISNEKASVIFSFLVIILAVYFLGVFIAHKISKLNAATKTADMVAGFFFGALKGLIVVSLLLILFRYIDVISDDDTKTSRIYPYVVDFAPGTLKIIANVLPGSKSTIDKIESFFPKDTLNYQ